jgi:parallel beta-helix repeat protein
LTIDIGVTSNRAPIAQITTDEQAGENELVFLYGGSSSDPDGDDITYQWVQLSGPPVQILHANEASASFVTPLIVDDQNLGFRLNVSDGEFTGHSDVVVLVTKLVDPSAVPDEEDPAGEVPIGLDLNGDGLMDAEDSRITCVPSTTEWKNLAFFPQNGVFEIAFSTVPQFEFMDAVVGLSSASINRFSGAAILIRFNPGGTIDVRNGGAYEATSQLFYTVETRYQFRVLVNVPAHTYSVFVTPENVEEITLATDYAFRTEQNTVTSLGYWNLWSDVGTTLDLCNLRVSAATLAAHAGADVTVSPGGSTVLNGEASGGQGPYVYSWSPATGLNNAQIATPTVTPTETTEYTLTVTDVWGVSRTDTVTVSLRSAILQAKAGIDQEMAAGGSVPLDGTAVGGTSPYTFKWSPSTGLSSATVANPTARPAATITYALTVTDSNGASATDSMVVTVNGGSIGNAFVVAKGDPNASDTNPGTEAAPWKTLAKAANAARAGQTVLVKAGLYYETLKPIASGTAGNLVTFKAFPGDECKGAFAGTKTDCRVVIDGQNTRTNGINAYPRKFIRFEGFEIRNHTDDAVYLQGYYDSSCEGFEVVNNYVHHNKNDAISFRGNSRTTLVENNEITANSQTGISFGGGSGHTLRGNNIHYNNKDGMRGGGDHHVIEYNNLYDQFHTDLHPDGMDLGDLSDSILRHNTISDFTQLMYFHDYDNGGGFINLQIYGNVFYTDRYWTVNGGEAPAIFFDATFNNSPIQNVKIHSNTFVWTGYNGVIMYGGPLSDVVICNNIFYDSGIDLDGRTAGVKSDYNLFYNSRKPAGEGPNSITSNPQFVNYVRHQSWNVRLKSTSPAIDKGDPALLTVLGLTSVFEDLDGVTRPTGLRSDMGAYEFKP